MLGKVLELLGVKKRVDFKALIADGAIVVDVRSKGEYDQGHIPNSKLIPLDNIGNAGKKLPNKNQSIIVCCASGVRSAAAKRVLASKGYTQVVNGGGWFSLMKKITD